MTEVQYTKKYLNSSEYGRSSWSGTAVSRIAMIFLVTIFSGAYLVVTSTVSTKGYDINDLQKKIKSLQQENQKVELQIASYGSMERIQERVVALNLVKATDVSYINLPGTSVARR